MSGQNPLAYLHEKDSTTRSLMLRVAQRSEELRAEEREHQALLIINRLADALKRK